MPDRLWGRDAEFAQFDAALRAALGGRPSACIAVGESGIGKTALLRAVVDSAPPEVRVLWAGGLASEASPALWLWRQAFDSLEIDAAQDRFAMVEGLRRRLLAHQPVLLVVDDLQWLDESSLRALDYVIRRMNDERLFIAAALRTDDVSDGWRAAGDELLTEPAVRRVELPPLDDDAARAMLAATSDTRVDAKLLDEAVSLARGNPFYLGEIGRAWGLDETRGVPGSVTGAVRRRLARLDNATQEFLLAAAVLGEEAEIAVVAQCLATSGAACLPAVQRAVDAEFVTQARPGSLRFRHALVRSALLDDMPLQQRVALHQRAAEAIEVLYADSLEDHVADLARHAAEVAVLGDRQPAVNWAEQAARLALRQLAYEDAARLAELALDCGGPALDGSTRNRLLLLVAAAQWSAGRAPEAFGAAARAAADAGRQRNGTLLANAALAIEPIGELARDRELREWCVDALGLLGVGDVALRAQVTARLASTLVYIGDYGAALESSDAALALAEETADAETMVGALRARQLAVSGPDHSDERSVLAARMVELGQQLRRPDVEMWGRLWTIDVLWERGQLAAIAGELRNLRWCVDRVGSPMAQWHWLVASAALAQARAQFDEALRLAGEAFAITQALRNDGGFGAYMALLSSVGRHTAYADMLLNPPAHLGPDTGEVRAQIFAYVGVAFPLADSGRLVEASVLYRMPGPPQTWDMPPYFRVSLCAVGAHVAIALGALEDVRFFHDQLLPYRDTHVVTGAGTGNYFGPVELVIGRCAAALGDDGAAERSLRRAVDICTACATPGFLVEAHYELACLLQRTQRRAAADALWATAEGLAEQYGMTRWVELLKGRTQDPDDPLTSREREVAVLVAHGRTNRQIAEALVVSERTAANHVQHVLTKLGFSRRSEIAAWVASRGPGAPDQRK